MSEKKSVFNHIVNLENGKTLSKQIEKLDLTSVAKISLKIPKVIEDMVKKEEFSQSSLDRLKKHANGNGDGKKGEIAKEAIINYLKNLVDKDQILCAQLLDIKLIPTNENSVLNNDEEDEDEEFEPSEDEDEEYSKTIGKKEKNFVQETFEKSEEQKPQKTQELMNYYFGKANSYEESDYSLFPNIHRNLIPKIISAAKKDRKEVLQEKTDPWIDIQSVEELKVIILEMKEKSGYFKNNTISLSALQTMICGNQNDYESLIYHWVHLRSGKSYIGETTKDVLSRTREHISEAFSNGTGCRELNHMIRRSRPDDWRIYVIKDRIYPKDLKKFEEEYITRYDTVYPNGFNMKCK
jgi:hypothetical protein